MRRDLDLVRKLLLELEAKPQPEAVDSLPIEGYDDLTIRYHLLLLAQAKLIDYEPTLTKTGRIIQVLAFNPSWQGHEFLDAVRDETIWKTLKLQASERSTSMPFEIVKLLAIEAVKRIFGL